MARRSFKGCLASALSFWCSAATGPAILGLLAAVSLDLANGSVSVGSHQYSSGQTDRPKQLSRALRFCLGRLHLRGLQRNSLRHPCHSDDKKE